MATNVGNAVFELGLDPQKYYEGMEQARLDAHRMGREIQASLRGLKLPSVAIGIDDRQLTRLNRHIELKRSHVRDVNAWMRSNPIRPQVDLKSFDQLEQRIKRLKQRQDIDIKVNIVENRRSTSSGNAAAKETTEAIDKLGDVLGDKLGKQISKGVRQGLSKNPIQMLGDTVTSIPKTIARGFYEGIGLTYSEQLTKGFIKGIEGKFGTSISRIGERTSTAFLNAGQKAGDRFLKGIGIADGTAAIIPLAKKARAAMEEIIPLDVLEKKLGRLESAIGKVLDSIAELDGNRAFKGLGEVGAALGDVATTPIVGVNRRRDRKLDLAAQLAQKRAQEMIERGELQQIQQGQRVVIASGGFAGSRGKSSASVADRVRQVVGGNAAVDYIDNVETDTSVNVNKTPKWAAEILARFGKQNVSQGFNADAVEAAAKAIAYQQMGASATDFIGYSGGGYVAKEATEILSRTGRRSRGVGIGTPMFGLTGQVAPEQFVSFVGEGDPLSKLPGRSANQQTLKKSGQNHKLSNYLGGEDFQQQLQKFLDVQVEAAQVAQIELLDFGKDLEALASDIAAMLDPSQAAFYAKTGLFQAPLEQIKANRAKLASLMDGAMGDVAEQIAAYDEALAEAEAMVKQVFGVREQTAKPQQVRSQEVVKEKIEPTLPTPKQTQATTQKAVETANKAAKNFQQEYQKFVVETAKAFGMATQSIRVPELKEFADIPDTVAGGYAEVRNQIVFPKGKLEKYQQTLNEAIAQMSAEQIDQAIIQLSTIAHESLHGIQAGFSGLDPVQQARMGRLFTPEIQASPEEAAVFQRMKGDTIDRFAQSSAQHTRNRKEITSQVSPEELQQIEQFTLRAEKDAYAFQAKFMAAMLKEAQSGAATIGDAFEQAFRKLAAETQANMKQLAAQQKPQIQQAIEPIDPQEFNRNLEETRKRLNQYTAEVLKEMARLSGRSARGKKADIISDLTTFVRPDELERVRAAVDAMIVPGKRGGQQLQKRSQSDSEKQAVEQYRQQTKAMYAALAKVRSLQGKEFEAQLGSLLDNINQQITFMEELAKKPVAPETRLDLGRMKGQLESVYREMSPRLMQARGTSLTQGIGINTEQINGGFTPELNKVVQQQAVEVSRQAQRSFQSIVRSVGAASKKAVSPGNMPRLSVDDARLAEMGAKAFYDIKRNTIVINSEIAKILEAGPKALQQYAAQLTDVVHEARHAAQFDFGKRSLRQVAQSGAAIDMIDPRNAPMSARYNAARNAAAARQQASGMMSRRTLGAIFRTEADAYAFEQFTPQVLQGAEADLQRRSGVRGMAIAAKERVQQVQGNIGNAVNEFRSASQTIDQIGEAASKAIGSIDKLTDSFLEFGVQALRQIPGGDLFAGLLEGAGKFKGALKALVVGFVVFQILQQAIAALGQFATASLDAAQSLEQLGSQFNSALGAAGAGALDAANQAAIDLKINLDQARQTYLDFATSTQGTPLESMSDDMARVLLQAGRSRGLTNDQIGRARVALSQIASKGGAASSEEVRQQLGEAIPGSAGIAARGLGMSTGEFNARLAQGGIQGTDFVRAYIAQLDAESSIGLSGSLDTTAASAANLDNQFRQLQETLGKPLLPVKKLGMDVLAGAIQALSTALPALVQLITGALLAAMGMLAASTIKAVGAFKLLGLAGIGLQKTFGLILAFLKQPALSFAGLTVGIAAAIDVVKIFSTAFSDLGGSASKTAEEIRKAREEIGKLRNEEKPEGGDTGRSLLGETAIGAIFGRDNVAAAERFVQQRLGLQTFGEQEFQAQQAARADVVREAEATVGEVLGQIALSRSPNSKFAQVRGLDSQIRDLQTQRGLLAPGDNDARRTIDAQIRTLSQRREGLLPDINKTIAANNAAIEGLKKTREEAEKLGDTDSVARLTQAIEAAQQAQDELNKVMASTVKTIALIRAEFENITGRFQETNQQVTMRAAQMRTAIAESTMTVGQREFAGTIAGLSEMQQRIEANNAAIERMNALLSDTESQRVLNAAGFDNSSSPADIRQRAATMAEGSDRDRLEAAAQQIEAIRGYEVETAQLQQQIAESRQQAGQRIRDLTRQVSDFYRGLGRQTQEIQQTIASLRLEAEFARTKAAINRALGRFKDTFFDELIGGMDQIADLMNQIAQIPGQAAQQIAQIQNQIADAQLQGQDLSNQMPNGAMVPGGAAGGNVGGAFRSGLFTGPAGRIGAGAEYHIDTKFSRDLSLDEMVKLFDQLAAAYRAQGRQIEFSNAAVAGMVYDERKSLEERRSTLDRALNAHHSQERDRRNGVRSVDYYIPQIGQNRFGASAENAEILLPNIAGAQVAYNSGGGYGNYATISRNGQMVMMTGHGDTARALPQNRTLSAAAPVAASPRTQQSTTAMPAGSLFSGGSNSLAARVVGISEGTRTADGGKTAAWGGHTDPGNAAHNMGSFSFQGGASSPEDADRQWNQRLASAFAQYQQAAQRAGVNANDPQLAFNFLDLYTQAPLAATGQGGFLDQLPAIAQGRSILDARVQAYVDPRSGRLDAPGFGNDPARLRADQQRRMNALSQGIAANGLAGAASGIGARVATANNAAMPGMPSGTVQNAGLINQGVGQFGQAGQQQIQAIGANAAAQSELLVQQLTTLLGSLGQGIRAAGREIDTQAIEQQRNARRAEFDALEQTPAVQLQRELFDLQAQSQDLERNSGLERLRRSQEALQASIPQLQQRREAAISQGLPQETIAQFDSLLKQTQERIAANAEAEKQITDAIKAQSEAIQKQIQLREEQYRRAQQQAVFEAQQRNFSIGRETVQQRIQGMRSRQFDFGALGEANQAEFDLRQGELMSQLDTQMRDYQEQLRQLRIQQDVMPTAETQAQIDLLNETIERTKELNAATLENYRNEFEQNTRAIEQQRRALDNELVSSQMAPIRERSSGLRAMGFETQAMGIDRELAIVDIQQELSNTLADIQSRAGLSAEAVAQLTNNAHALAQVKLDNVSQQFSIMGQLLPGIQQGFQGFFTGLLTGSQSLEEAFKGMVDTILNQVAQLASQMLVNELLGGLFGMGGGKAVAGMGQGMGGGILGAAASVLGGVAGFKDGGVVGSGGGDSLALALQKEGPKARLAALTPGELVLTTKQTRRFFELGYDRDVLNFKQGGMVPGGSPAPSLPRGGGITVNVPVSVEGGKGSGDRVDGDRLGNAIRSAVITEINNQKKPGGALF